MSRTSLLIANRGEIAIRVMRAAAELGIETVGVFSEDDAHSLHVRKADRVLRLSGSGAAAYLDAEQLIAAAREAGCAAVHPGYGFLAENPAFAARCADAGLRFVGPRPETLALFGDKARARGLAARCGVPVLRGTDGPTSAEGARAFLHALPEGASMVIKALAGGGGRGMRVVQRGDEVDAAHARCQSEARSAFGNGDVYVERLLPRARHIEVQIVGDHSGEVVHLYERECSIQRRHQKLVELAPSPSLEGPLRDRLLAAAVRMAHEARYESLGTFEFLVDESASSETEGFAFIEANARLQVEHTVTEEVTGVDLVKLQLRLAEGRALADLGLAQHQVSAPRGFAIQVRVNAETMGPDGAARASSGTLSAFEPPSGPGVRCDTSGYVGYVPNPRFDSLLAKLIVDVPDGHFSEVVRKTYHALCEFRIEGVPTNLGLLQNLLRHPDFEANRVHTRFVEEHIDELLPREDEPHRRLFFEPSPAVAAMPQRAGARIDAQDPLAVLSHGKSAPSASATASPAPGTPVPTGSAPARPEGSTAVLAPLQGTIVSIEVGEGDLVRAGQALLVMEAMKMEHVIEAARGGVVQAVVVEAGDAVFEGHALAFVEETGASSAAPEASREVDLDRLRPDLDEVMARHAVGLDAARPDAVARRRKTGQRTARENISDLCDEGTLVEYGPLVVAAQRRRRSEQDLIERTPADGMIAAVGAVNGALFGEERARCVLMSYDYTVLAGTQGAQNHRKKDRMFELALRSRMPVVFFTEGGGGRPGDTDGLGVVGLDCLAFQYFGRLSGEVPLVGINSGRCFAGNAALLGCCDVVIATANFNIGMGGPAMNEGGGLGVFRPEEVGPIEVQVANGVVDLPVADEAEAVEVARKYLSYFQGPLAEWECADQRRLRAVIPENRLRVYDVRAVVETLADTGSVLELRRGFAHGMVTALARIEGRPVGIVANNPIHLAGAIDSDGADKAARFMQLCDAFDIPLLFLCDTPGIMVGPEAEKTALVRHAARMFVTGASLSVPFFSIVLRKGYGLGAQAMAGGSFKAPVFTVSWPTGEFGGMGLEGAVKLGFRKELEALEDPDERMATYEKMVARMYEVGKAVNIASHFEIDDVIDPMQSRSWIMSALRSLPARAEVPGGKRPCVDTW